MQRLKIKKKNNSFLNGEKYESLIREISQLKRGERTKEPRDYQLLKRYDVVQIRNTVKLIYPAAEGNSSKSIMYEKKIYLM